MEYLYDVFISYKNHNVTNPWVTKFEEKLKYWLTQEIGGEEARIFFDKETIEIGSLWPDTLRKGLKLSKCLLCIWTPEYFRSKWCRTEWRSFEARDKQFNLNATYSLIYPIRFADGEHYPQAAKDRQALDVRNFNATLDAFWQTAKAVELEDQIKILAKKLALAIGDVPDYDDNFPIVEINDNPTPPSNNRLML